MEKQETFGTPPPARFGQTITYISKGFAILFGGATGDTGKYSITNDTYSFELITRIWKKLECSGELPSPRAAHASVAVELNQMVIYGGATGGGSLASDDLYLFDIKPNTDVGVWKIIAVIGTTPGRRYGHSITYSRPYLIVFGGNIGQEPVNDLWILNIEKSPFSWIKLDPKSELPIARVYHSAAHCQSGSANGMIVVFGGRSIDSTAMNDSWGLRRHRDGRWDWVRAPYKQDKELPLGRYQHSSVFLGTFLIIIGGRTNNVGERVSLDVYDTETSEWFKFVSIQRFRHASWVVESNIFVYGGFEHESPNIPTDSLSKINLLKLFQGNDLLLNKCISNSSSSPQSLKQLSNPPGNSTPSLQQKKTALSELEPPKKGSPMPNQQQQPTSKYTDNNQNKPNFNEVTMGKNSDASSILSTGQSNNSPNQSLVGDKPFKMANKAVVVEENKNGDNSKYVTYALDNNMRVTNKAGLMPNPLPHDSLLHHQFLNVLLQPKSYLNLPEDAKFLFRSDQIIALCDQAQPIIESQPMVLKIRAPIKLFGDVHGQYSDLMRFFDLYGTPYENGQDGDIESFDYLFLGDFVDRGSHSLETICLLLALKIKYPDQVHLIRGNHEDRWINNGFGFSEECAIRLGEDPNEDDSVFNRFNTLFDYLPLAAIVEEKIICLHGGIGSSLNYIEEIENLERPLEVIHEVSSPEQQLVVDILWSDPTDSDTELGILPNTIRDPGGTGNIVKFGPDRVQQFLNNNNLSMIIRAHECVMDGFERFAGGQLITVFSATDYCGKHKNAGAVLILKKNFEIIPKLIYPSNGSTNNWIEDEEQLKKRPPTPPRWKNDFPRKNSYD